MFDNARDANQYLAGTVCYWGGAPVYVDSVDGDFMAAVFTLPYTHASKHTYVDVRDPLFNCREYALGYLNSIKYKRAIYVTRRPVRGVAQGLNDTNLVFNGEIRGDGLRFNGALSDEGFRDMLVETYPSREETLERLAQDDVTSVAIGPNLALKKHGPLRNLKFLEYRGREISFSETLEFRLPTEMSYLKEVCAPCGFLDVA